MEDFRKLLNIKLFSQPFDAARHPDFQLVRGKIIAELYSSLENSISVLSDMKARKSYVYYGAAADHLGLQQKETEINSIWEEELLNRTHAEDLQKKYRLELRFFQLLHSLDVAERENYHIIMKLRIRNKEGKYIPVNHRLFYISSSEDGIIRLALCLYNIIYEYPGFDTPDGVILNTQTGAIIGRDEGVSDILSLREKEILQLIKLGYQSKEIAAQLTLSVHTVSRHRQNIFKKLNVTNAMEACRIAEATKLC